MRDACTSSEPDGRGQGTDASIQAVVRRKVAPSGKVYGERAQSDWPRGVPGGMPENWCPGRAMVRHFSSGR